MVLDDGRGKVRVFVSSTAPFKRPAARGQRLGRHRHRQPVRQQDALHRWLPLAATFPTHDLQQAVVVRPVAVTVVST